MTSPQVIASPQPKPRQTMNFHDALKELVGGRKITRLEWEDGYYGLLKDRTLQLHKPDGKFYHWIVNEGDLLAIDWITVKPL